MKLGKIKNLMIFVLLTFMTLPCAGYGEEFIWGTEGNGLLISNYASIPLEKQNIIHQISDVLGIKYVKIRIRLPMNNEVSPDMCTHRNAYYTGSHPTCSRPDSFRFNLDETVELFKVNGWSMLPMFSHAGAPRQDVPIDSNHIERYVDFVDWFVGRYKESGNIRYIELVNAPSFTWHGTEKQLLELNNKTYERIKNKYPDVKVGTPGFEYFRDTSKKIRGDHLRFRNYFLKHDAKFDFWAFHGYPTRGDASRFDFYPPTKIAKNDRYSGIYGIVELRKTLNRKGWQNREILDMEHTGILDKGSLFNEEDDRVNAAYMAQQLVLKRSLKVHGKSALSGIVTLKMLPRCERKRQNRLPGRNRPRRGPLQLGSRAPQDIMSAGPTKQSIWGGECAWGSLYPDGSATLSVKAVGMLISKLAGLNHAGRISGDFDKENTVWIEKFKNQNRELYVCFKPFTYRRGQRLALEATTLPYSINLSRSPVNIEITDIYGNKTKANLEKTIRRSVGNAPQFVEISY